MMNVASAACQLFRSKNSEDVATGYIYNISYSGTLICCWVRPNAQTACLYSHFDGMAKYNSSWLLRRNTSGMFGYVYFFNHGSVFFASFEVPTHQTSWNARSCRSTTDLTHTRVERWVRSPAPAHWVQVSCHNPTVKPQLKQWASSEFLTPLRDFQPDCVIRPVDSFNELMV